MSKCYARQENDERVCNRCHLRWDIHDPEPPPCQPEPDATHVRYTTARELVGRAYEAGKSGERNIDTIIEDLQNACGK